MAECLHFFKRADRFFTLAVFNGTLLLALLEELAGNKNVQFLITLTHFKNRLFHSVGCKFSRELIQWFDSDCGIFQSNHKEDFGRWLDFYLKENHYKDKFSFFAVNYIKNNVSRHAFSQ